MKKYEIELVSITVKINGKKRIFKKEALSFYGWEQKCDGWEQQRDYCSGSCCGSHGGVDLNITDNKTCYDLALESY